MKTVLKIGIDALPNAELARFTALFQVAETRTRVAWTRVRTADADVVVSHKLPWRGTRAVGLCIDPAQPVGVDSDAIALCKGFRVLHLIAALDRAALRVLQSRGARPTNGAAAYGLRQWVVLGADKLSARYARVMSLMRRRTVTRDWMACGGSLSFADIDELLSELREHGALHASDAEPLVWQPAAPPSRPGLMGRLRSRISGEA